LCWRCCSTTGTPSERAGMEVLAGEPSYCCCDLCWLDGWFWQGGGKRRRYDVYAWKDALSLSLFFSLGILLHGVLGRGKGRGESGLLTMYLSLLVTLVLDECLLGEPRWMLPMKFRPAYKAGVRYVLEKTYRNTPTRHLSPTRPPSSFVSAGGSDKPMGRYDRSAGL
jgi:hypothetical protein